jgi:putative tryptophan/tyrosine transport system substrate-binding protein
MRRRDFIALLGAAASPLAARAQQGERIRRIGVLMQIGADDPEAPTLVGAFSQGLAEAGWIIGRNARIDYRWHQGNAEAARAYAAELLALTPDIIFASGTQGTIALKQLTRTVPIVFVNIADPVGVGIVDSLARPGGNITGFMVFDFSFGGKWPGGSFSRRNQSCRGRQLRCYSGHGDLSWAASDAGQCSQQ